MESLEKKPRNISKKTLPSSRSKPIDVKKAAKFSEIETDSMYKLMLQASKDPLFLSDVEEISHEFSAVDAG